MAIEACSQRDRLSRAVSRIQQGAVYAALGRWQEYTVEVQRERAIMTKAMSRIMNLRLSGAWSAWVCGIDEMVRLRGLHLKAARPANTANRASMDTSH